jgi:hypothetical protein
MRERQARARGLEKWTNYGNITHLLILIASLQNDGIFPNMGHDSMVHHAQVPLILNMNGAIRVIKQKLQQ